MKKILYSVFILAAAAMTGCKDADNGSSSDSAPDVTFYSYQAEAGTYDPDVDCPLRVIANQATDQLFALAEPISDKEAFVAANGSDAYMQRVIDQGQLFESTTVEYIFRNLKGDYAITAVAVAGNDRTAVEYIFNGVVYVPAGTAIGTTNLIMYVPAGGDPTNPDDALPCSGKVDLFRRSNSNVFYIANFFDQVSNGLYEQEVDQRLYFTFDADRKLVMFEPEAIQGSTKFLYCGSNPYVGYWDPTTYGQYCNVASAVSQKLYQVKLLVAQLGTTDKWINQIIQLNMTNANWYTAQ